MVENPELRKQFTHFVNITRRNSLRDASTADAMVDHVATYLADPSLERDGRRLVVQDQCQFLDGRAAERVAGFVAAELADVTGIQVSPTCVESLASSR